MGKLVQVSPTGPRNFISVDEDGVVWRGEIKTYYSGEEYIEWKLIPLGVSALIRSAEREREAAARAATDEGGEDLTARRGESKEGG